MIDPADPRWERFVAREPYFAVLPAEKYRRANLGPEQEREFFATGEAFVDWMLATIGQRVSSAFSPMSILDYGCGIGRLAVALTRGPASLTAVDRSPAMLQVARQQAAARGLTDIRFQTPAELRTENRRFDLVCCVLVLQRLRQVDGLALVRDLVGRIASGGVGVFQLPFRTSAPTLVRSSRWARERVPLLNGALNLARGKTWSEPFIASHTYDVEAVLGVLAEFGLDTPHVAFGLGQELSNDVLFVQVPMPPHEPAGLSSATEADAGPAGTGAIDVRDVIVRTSVEDLNRTAEAYFASLTHWDDVLAKPFSRPDDAPVLLLNFASLLQGLRLWPGVRVLDFGAGSGWLSRCLTQLGCEVTLADVSPTALRIARELYQRVPIVGGKPAPHFLQFDGAHIDLPDASVERIITFDAFHHVANPAAVLREFARILTPGGIAAFAEPGPRHSQSPMSQFEMRSYGVLENDIDVRDIWRTARQCGFKDIQLAVFEGLPFHVSLAEFEDLLAGGETGERWLTLTRMFLRNVRNFFLLREGEEPHDSRQAGGLACRFQAMRVASALVEGQPFAIEAIVTNSGSATWLEADAVVGGVRVAARLYDESGAMVNFAVYSDPMTDPPRRIAPGDALPCRVTVPPQPAGRYRIELDCVASQVAWFAQSGASPATMIVDVRRATP